jgi:hypothetical protein
MRAAFCIVVHKYADDLEPYARLFGSVGSDMDAFFRASSRHTCMLWDSMQRRGSTDACSLERIGATGLAVVFRPFHRIEKYLRRHIVDPDEHKFTYGDRFVNKKIYGHSCAWSDHSFFEIFELAICTAHACMHANTDALVLVDEDVVLRACSAASDLLHHAAAQFAAIARDQPRGTFLSLCSDRGIAHESLHLQLPGAAVPLLHAPPSYDAWMVDRPAARALSAAMHAARQQPAQRHVAAYHPHERCAVWTMDPPVFFPMDAYLLLRRPRRAFDCIEDAIIHCRAAAAAGAAPEQDPAAPPPRALHQVWLGGSMPPTYRRELEHTRRIHGDQATTLWANEHVRAFPHTLAFARVATTYAMLVNMMRLEILYHHGGVYFDADFAIRRNVFALFYTPLVFTKEFFKDENQRMITNSLIGANAHNLIILKLLSYLRRSICKDRSYLFTSSCGIMHLAKIHRAIRHEKKMVRTLPPELFFHPDWNVKHARAEECFGRHLYDISWT